MAGTETNFLVHFEHRSGRNAAQREVVSAPGKNRTCARGLGNHCSIH
jgi:hypothetical protein